MVQGQYIWRWVVCSWLVPWYLSLACDPHDCRIFPSLTLKLPEHLPKHRDHSANLVYFGLKNYHFEKQLQEKKQFIGKASKKSWSHKEKFTNASTWKFKTPVQDITSKGRWWGPHHKKVFNVYVKGLIYKVFKELQMNEEKTNNSIGEWRKAINRPWTENINQVTVDIKKCSLLTSNRADAKEEDDEKSFSAQHIGKNVKSLTISSVGKGTGAPLAGIQIETAFLE